MKSYFICHAGDTIENIVANRFSGKDPIMGTVYEWRGEYVREPADDDRFIEMIVYDIFSGRRLVAGEHHLYPIEVPEYVTSEPNGEFGSNRPQPWHGATESRCDSIGDPAENSLLKECEVIYFWINDRLLCELEAVGDGVREAVELGELHMPWEVVEMAIVAGIEELVNRGWNISDGVIEDIRYNFLVFWNQLSGLGNLYDSMRLMDEEMDDIRAIT